MSVATVNSTLVLEVRDDGNGSVDPTGSGLRGLTDRVAALGGRMSVAGGPASGTVLRAEIPTGIAWRHEGDRRRRHRADPRRRGPDPRRGGFDVVGKAADAEDLMRKVRAHKPDVAIVDIRMPPDNTDDGLRAAVTIREELPDTGVLVLSQYVEEEYAVESRGFHGGGRRLPPQGSRADVDRFVDAVRRVAEGGSALDPEVVGQLVGRATAG